MNHRTLLMSLCLASASCAELLGIESATVDASIQDSASEASDGGNIGVRCGDTYCVAQGCCLGGIGCEPFDGNASNGNCLGSFLRCDDPSDCQDASLCCLTSGDGGGISAGADVGVDKFQSACVSSCSGKVMCDPNADVIGCSCDASVTLKDASYFVCSP